jgi:hypothetical protein
MSPPARGFFREPFTGVERWNGEGRYDSTICRYIQEESVPV